MLEVGLLSLVFGSVIVILALSFCFSYRFEKYVNFNYVALFLVGAYLGWTFSSYIGLGRVAGLIIIAVLSAVLGAAFYIPTYFLKNNYNKIIFSIAVLAFVQGCLRLIFGVKKTMPKPTEGLMIGKTLINSTSLMSVLFLVFVLIVIYILVQRTKLGKSIRAVLDDERTARIVGIDLNFIKITAIIGASILAGVAGLLYSLNIGKASLNLLPGFKAMAVAIIGGFGIGLTTILAFILVLVENFATVYLPMSEYYSNFIIFGALLVIMFIRIPKRGRL